MGRTRPATNTAPEAAPAGSRRRRWACLAGAVALWACLASARGDLSLETETARLLPPGKFELSAAFEFQTSPNGQDYASPLALEFGVVDRVELLIEPVPFTSIQPRGGKPANGLGDTEVTLTYLVLSERPAIPAIAIAGEVKIPTATNLQIGKKEFDYRVYAIASKRVGDFDLHFNVGYTFTGEPPNVRTRNPIDVEFAAEWFLNDKFDLFAEVTYTGSSLRSSGSSENVAATARRGHARSRASEGVDTGAAGVIAAEVAGEEIVGTVGIRHHLTPEIDLFGSFSYDNNDDKLFRTEIS